MRLSMKTVVFCLKGENVYQIRGSMRWGRWKENFENFQPHYLRLSGNIKILKFNIVLLVIDPNTSIADFFAYQ